METLEEPHIGQKQEVDERYTAEYVAKKLLVLNGDDKKFLEEALNKKGNYELGQVASEHFLDTLEEGQFKMIASLLGDLQYHQEIESKKKSAKEIADYLAAV
jgi:hypothetical protein